MEIELKLSKDFERYLEELKKLYGEDFEFINGVHPSQLDFSEFINNFVANDTVADASIDPNANANHKDIRSFMTEKGKSEDKLFALNKIFLEIKQKWGLRTAKEWLKQEFSKGFYLNDSATASYFPYCYKGEETAIYKYNNEVLFLNFIQLYNYIKESEEYDESIKQCAKFPHNLYVLDIVNNQQTFTKVKRVVKHYNDLPMRVLKTANGITQIVTENHPVIIKQGEKYAKEVTNTDEVFTVQANYFDESISEIGNYTLTKELGWLIGMALAEGYVSSDSLFICQNTNSSEFNRIVEILNKFNVKYSVYDNRKIYVCESNLKQFVCGFLKNYHSYDKCLPADFIHYNKDFLKGIIAGLVDGDGTIIGKYGREINIRIASETLIHQVSSILSCFDIFGRERIPYKGSGIGKTHKTIYGITFRVWETDFYHDFISIKFNNSYIPSKRKLKQNSSLNHKYSCSYDYVNLINNNEFIEEVEEVYDITTETGHFICNNILSHNCWANDLTRLATEGLFFLNKYNNQPPKHLTTYFDDVIEFVSFLSNRQSGAVGLPNVIIWAYYFWKHDMETGYFMKDPDYYLRQQFQKFIYRLNQPFLRIDQSAFTNVSIFDRPYLESLFGGMEFPDGSFAIDQIEEIINCQKIFMEVVSEIREENMFTYPVLSYSLLYKDNKFQDEPFAKWCSTHNMKWSDSNFFVSDNVGVLSNCCRLLSDTKELDPFINSIGGTALSVGSCRVSTINLVRIAYETKCDRKKYIKLLKERVALDCKALYSMRFILKRNIEKGLLPNYQDGAVEFDKQFCTIGGIGLYEVMDLFGLINTDESGNKSYSDEAIDFASEILDTINEVKDNFVVENQCDFKYNVEMIPAENCAGVICTADNLLYEQDKYFIYSNQWIPLMEKCTIQEKCKLGSLFDKRCGGGCIAHINIEGRFPNEEVAWNMLNYVASQGVIYFAFTTKISVCQHKHAFIGSNICPNCGEPVADTYSRVVGFYVPTSSYQKIRKREFNQRKWYNAALQDSVIG